MSNTMLQVDCRFTYPSGFTLEAGFILPEGISAILGPSGSGKSTCLSLIAGWLRPNQGSIRLHDQPLVDRPSRRWLAPHRRRIGLVAQDHLLFPHLTVRANLRYGMRRHMGCERDDRLRLDDVVEMLELGDLLGRHPAQLSGGQQRRVALGRALLSGPQLLLLDEPLSGLDEPLQDRVLTMLEQIHACWRTSMVLVSHDMAQVRRIARYAVTLAGGRVTGQGAVMASGLP